MVTFCAACDQTEARLNAVGYTRGDQAAERSLPDYPSECRKKTRGGVVAGDRQDAALLKVDNALYRQHLRTDDCAAWYDQLQSGWNSAGPQ